MPYGAALVDVDKHAADDEVSEDDEIASVRGPIEMSPLEVVPLEPDVSVPTVHDVVLVH